MAGFGALPGDFGDAGIPVPRPPENNEQQFTDDIHALRVKVVDGNTNVRLPLQLAANQAIRQDMQGQRVNSLILTVVTGQIRAYLFDVTNNSGLAAGLPDLVVSAAVVPTTVQIMVPEREDYIIGIQEGAGAAATGSIRVAKV